MSTLPYSKPSLPHPTDYEWQQYVVPALQPKALYSLPPKDAPLFNLRQPEDDPDQALLLDLQHREPIPASHAPPPRDHRPLIFKAAILDAKHTPESTLPARIKCCWRIVREMAIKLQLIAPDEPLALLDSDRSTGRYRDSWAEGTFPSHLLNAPPRQFQANHLPIPPMSQQARQFIGRPPILIERKNPRGNITGFDEAVYQSAYIPPPLMTHTLVEALPPTDPDYDPDHPDGRPLPPPTVEPVPGLSLLPPEIPLPWLDSTGQPLPDYDPEDTNHDPLLALWLQAFYRTAKSLRIEEGSVKDPTLGMVGLKGMFEPVLVRSLFPSRTQLMYYESMVVQEIGEIIATSSVLGAAKTIKHRYGMEPYEVAGMMSLARKTLAAQYECRDPDVNRSMMILRLEDYVHRAKEGLNLDAEFKGLKEMALIMGLTAEPGDNDMGDFVEVMRRISSATAPSMARAIDVESRPLLEELTKKV